MARGRTNTAVRHKQVSLSSSVRIRIFCMSSFRHIQLSIMQNIALLTEVFMTAYSGRMMVSDELGTQRANFIVKLLYHRCVQLDVLR